MSKNRLRLIVVLTLVLIAGLAIGWQFSQQLRNSVETPADSASVVSPADSSSPVPSTSAHAIETCLGSSRGEESPDQVFQRLEVDRRTTDSTLLNRVVHFKNPMGEARRMQFVQEKERAHPYQMRLYAVDAEELPVPLGEPKWVSESEMIAALAEVKPSREEMREERELDSGARLEVLWIDGKVQELFYTPTQGPLLGCEKSDGQALACRCLGHS